MSESKVYMFPDAGGFSGNKGGIDPALLLALNQNGGFGGNGNWMWIFFLWFLYPMMQNGMFGNGMWGNGFGGFGNGGCNGFGGLANLINNNDGRELLMQAINRNEGAIERLAGLVGCKSDTVISAINGVMSQIQNVGNQVGMSGMEVINAIQSGNCKLGQQIAECCCENRLAICQQTNTLQSEINRTNVGLERGFSSIAFETQKQTCELGQTIRDSSRNSTDAILNKLDSMERNALQDKIDALREAKSTLTTQLNLEHQNAFTAQVVGQAVAPVQAGLANLQKEVDCIKCKLPETTTVPYSPVTAIPNCVAFNYGLYGNGFGFGNGAIWG